LTKGKEEEGENRKMNRNYMLHGRHYIYQFVLYKLS